MTSQREIWEARYREHVAPGIQPQQPSDFARRVGALLPHPSDVLELGCGRGWDAAYFAGLGHRVLATDFSDALIRSNRDRLDGLKGLSFAVLDTSQASDLKAGSYDLVYARLSLHYFDDATTRGVFDDIARVLRQDGLLTFMCKSTDDPLYGKGLEVGVDVFHCGHQRHFFSEAYARELLAADFEVVSLVMRKGLLYDSPSAWVEAVARVR